MPEELEDVACIGISTKYAYKLIYRPRQPLTRAPLSP